MRSRSGPGQLHAWATSCGGVQDLAAKFRGAPIVSSRSRCQRRGLAEAQRPEKVPCVHVGSRGALARLYEIRVVRGAARDAGPGQPPGGRLDRIVVSRGGAPSMLTSRLKAPRTGTSSRRAQCDAVDTSRFRRRGSAACAALRVQRTAYSRRLPSIPLSSCSPRSSNAISEPATRS